MNTNPGELSSILDPRVKGHGHIMFTFILVIELDEISRKLDRNFTGIFKLKITVLSKSA